MKQLRFILRLICLFLFFQVSAQTSLFTPNGGAVGSSTNSNVGIGTNNMWPTEKLDVDGSTRIRGSMYMSSTWGLSFIRTNLYWDAAQGRVERYFSNHPSLELNLSGGGFSISTAPAGPTNASVPMTNIFRVLSDGNVGIGTASPETKFHVAIGNYGVKTQQAKAVIEANDAHLDIISSSDATWGSGFNLIEGNGTSNTDIWSFYRETTGGSGNSNLHFKFGSNSSVHANATRLLINSSGDVGIGTSSPGKKLEVNGDILLRNSSGLKQIYTWNSTDANWRIGMNQNPGFTRSMTTQHVQYITYNGNNSQQGFAIGVNGGNSSFEVRGSDHKAFFRGAVGIGTTSVGTHELAVEGTVGAREVKVEASGWSDHVFEETYDLMELEQVDQFITENKHLPGIPTEQEVMANGINLGEMNAKLLEKIEELTLYLIDQNKDLQAKELKLQELEERLEKLER